MTKDPRNDLHDFRLAVERQVLSTLVVGSASVGQSLQFGSGGLQWVTPAPASSAAITEVEVDFGETPVYSASIVVTAAACAATDNVLVTPSANPATGRGTDDGLWDGLILSAKAGTGQFTLHAMAVPGPIVGKRNILYQLGT